jgi:hypothetical protein
MSDSGQARDSHRDRDRDRDRDREPHRGSVDRGRGGKAYVSLPWLLQDINAALCPLPDEPLGLSTSRAFAEPAVPAAVTLPPPVLRRVREPGSDLCAFRHTRDWGEANRGPSTGEAPLPGSWSPKSPRGSVGGAGGGSAGGGGGSGGSSPAADAAFSFPGSSPSPSPMSRLPRSDSDPRGKRAAYKQLTWASLQWAVPHGDRLAGYLYHREPRLRGWEWRRRWCVLSGCLFVVFEDREERADRVLVAMNLGAKGHREVVLSKVCVRRVCACTACVCVRMRARCVCACTA